MNRNTVTKFVPPMNVIDSKSSVHSMAHHIPPSTQQSSLISTNGSCHSGSSTNTTNSLNSHSSSCGSGSSPLENLPKKFVSSMRTLFDIMDDKRTGFVRLSDIEARWQDDGSKGLPHGVIDCLRRVTPVSGMLSFERFCAGLKICLLRNQANDCKMGSIDSNSNSNSNNIVINNENNRNSSDSNKINNNHGNHMNNILASTASINEDTNKTTHIYKRSSLPVQRTLSLPKLSPCSDGDSSSDPYIMPVIPSVYAPPKPPRTALLLSNGSSNSSNDSKDRCDKAEIRNALQNWQMNVLMNEWEAKDKRRAMALPSTSYINRDINRGTADGSSNNTITNHTPFQQHQQQQQQQQQTSSAQQLNSSQKSSPSIYPANRSPTLLEFQKKSNRRRDDRRRHTLQNGIDYNMLKRIRHFEEEKDLLLDGLVAIEKAQEWYFKQIALIQEKMKSLGRGDGHLEQWSDAYEERLDLQRARIMEVNRHLASLEESWEQGGFPMHMNLAVRNHYYINNNGRGLPQFFDVQMNQLKVQNRKLTEEVSQKSERITDLEMERKSLYRELLQHQQQYQQMQQQLLRKQGHILCGNEEVIF